MAQQPGRIGQHDAISSWQPSSGSFTSNRGEGKSIAQQIIDVMGLSANFDVRVANIPNAAAVVYGGKRYILYNPTFLDKLNKATGTKWAAVSVLAHEIGHHLNGHTITGNGSQQNLELEADEFSGFVLRKMGANLQEAQVAMKLAASERASRTHPGQGDRLVAIQRGWDRADDQANGRPTTTRTAPAPVTQETAVVQQPSAQPVISSSSIIGDIRFDADPNARFFVTSRYNVVKVKNNQLQVIGKLGNLNDARFPYAIYDESTQLLVDRSGAILNKQGRRVGMLTSRS